MLKNTENSYGLVARILHWTIGIMILIMLTIGFTMIQMANSDQKFQFYGLHKATGVLILLLVALRLTWRLLNSSVLLPLDLPSWQKKASYVTHILLYLLMFIMPSSGVLMSILGGHEVNVYGLFTIAAFEQNLAAAKIAWLIHYYAAYLLTGLIALHFAAALYHHFVRRDNILMRMIKNLP